MKSGVILAAALLMAGCVAQVPVSSGSGAALTATAPANSGLDGLLNNARASAGLSGVSSSAKLDAVAKAHADDMVARDYFAHTTPEGVSFGARLSAAGIRSCAAAENIAWGQRTASAAMTSWMGSAPHKANILHRSVTSYGVGQSGGHWVLVLVRPC